MPLKCNEESCDGLRRAWAASANRIARITAADATSGFGRAVAVCLVPDVLNRVVCGVPVEPASGLCLGAKFDRRIKTKAEFEVFLTGLYVLPVCIRGDHRFGGRVRFVRCVSCLRISKSPYHRSVIGRFRIGLWIDHVRPQPERRNSFVFVI